MNEDEHRAGPGLTICALLLPELSTIPPSSGLSSFLPSFLALVNTHTRARTGGQIVCMQTDREWSGRTQRFACGRPLRTWLSLWNYVPADFRDSLMGRGNDWIMARSHISQSAEVTPFTRFFFFLPFNWHPHMADNSIRPAHPATSRTAPLSLLLYVLDK